MKGGGARVSTGCFAERFHHHVDLTAAERSALLRLEEQRRTYRRGTVIRREGEVAEELFIVRSGWCFSCMIMADGGRQIMRLHLGGDLIGASALAFRRSPVTLVALTDVVLCPFGADAIGTLLVEHPRLAGLIFALGQVEHVTLTDRLASLGRTSARARVAALLLDITHRLRVTGQADEDGFVLPLTQEEIGDVTGLTAVHVNRMLRALAEAGLIRREGGRLRLIDEAKLTALASYENRYAAMVADWLPDARS